MKPIKGQFKDLCWIVVGILMYSFGFTIFVLPHSIVIGGMAGFSTLVYYATGGLIPVAVTMYAANLLLLLGGLKELGKGFVFRTIFGATIMSLTIGCLEGYFTSHAPLITSTPLSVALGSVIMGFGIGVYYSHHGTAGGTDIVAAIMSRRTSMSMGRVMMIVDVTIVALSFFLPFDGTMEERIQSRTQTIIYGWLAIVIYSWLADRYVQQGNQTIQFIILSDDWKSIARRVCEETGRGVTTWDARGYWTGENREMLMIWCRKFDVLQIYRIVSETDPNAYITQSHVQSVYGNGFDHMKIRHPKSKSRTPKSKAKTPKPEIISSE